MKTEDIERLKKICDKEGFEVTRSREGSILFHIKKKDPWDGVEFYRYNDMVCKITSHEIDSYGREIIWNTNGKWILKSDATPATESEYVEQLKEEAQERLGKYREREIDYSDLGIHPIAKKTGFVYNKIHDSLHWCGVPVYCDGKWAKVVERVKVTESELTGEAFWNVFKFRVKGSLKVKKSGDEIKEFLSQKLENYLNDKPE